MSVIFNIQQAIEFGSWSQAKNPIYFMLLYNLDEQSHMKLKKKKVHLVLTPVERQIKM